MTPAPAWDQLARDCELLPDELRVWSRRYLKNHRQRYESDLRLLERFYRGGEVLEIGAAPCQLTVVLLQRGYPVQAVDLDPDRFLPIIRKYSLPVIKCDIERERFPFERARFSFILFNEVFEHLRIDPIVHSGRDPPGLAAGRFAAERACQTSASPGAEYAQSVLSQEHCLVPPRTRV